jgi:hypothetical protein
MRTANLSWFVVEIAVLGLFMPWDVLDGDYSENRVLCTILDIH